PIIPFTAVNDGEPSIAIAGDAVKPLTAAAILIVPAVETAGATTEPQPRRICAVVCGNAPNVTVPFKRTVSFVALRSMTARGIGRFAGQAAGATTFNVCSPHADG